MSNEAPGLMPKPWRHTRHCRLRSSSLLLLAALSAASALTNQRPIYRSQKVNQSRQQCPSASAKATKKRKAQLNSDHCPRFEEWRSTRHRHRDLSQARCQQASSYVPGPLTLPHHRRTEMQERVGLIDACWFRASGLENWHVLYPVTCGSDWIV